MAALASNQTPTQLLTCSPAALAGWRKKTMRSRKLMNGDRKGCCLPPTSYHCRQNRLNMEKSIYCQLKCILIIDLGVGEQKLKQNYPKH